MKPDYKNWVPKGMVIGSISAAAAGLILLLVFGVFGFGVRGDVRIALTVIFSLVFAGFAIYGTWCVIAYRAFSYNGKIKLSEKIINGVAQYVRLPEGGRGLDVGCGSGALTIACAKRNSQGEMTGIDRWGAEYGSFSKRLCEENARKEGVSNINFRQGDAFKIDFPDETFDAVTSNYVYHNIAGVNKQKILLETFRVLNKGGTFAIHDLMTPARYGDMTSFVNKLKDIGFKKVELINTVGGKFMTKKEAKILMLNCSVLLVGKK